MRITTVLIAVMTWWLSALMPAAAVAADADLKPPTTTAEMDPLYTVHFGFADDAVGPEDKQGLAALATRVAGQTGADTPLVVTGYTDDIGPQQYNDDLALRRARSVRTVLSDAGLSSVLVEGRGKTDYVASNETPEGRALNRRAEVRLAFDTGTTGTRIGRYSVVVPGPTRVQMNPLASVRHFDLEALMTVGDAMDAVLRGTGWRRAGSGATDPAARALFHLPLPDVHRAMGPIRTDQALAVLCGHAFTLVTDPVHRLVSCDLRRELDAFREVSG